MEPDHTFSLELRTTALVGGILTTMWLDWWTGSHTRAGRFKFSMASSAINLWAKTSEKNRQGLMNIQHIVVQVLEIFDTCLTRIYIQAVQSAAYSYYIYQSCLESISRSKVLNSGDGPVSSVLIYWFCALLLRQPIPMLWYNNDMN